MTRRNAFTSLLAGLLPWSWFGRKHPKFELTMEPVPPTAINYSDGLFVGHEVRVLINGKHAVARAEYYPDSTGYSAFVIYSKENIFPDLTSWMEANPDVLIGRYTRPPKETPEP